MRVPAGGLDARPLQTSYEKLMSKTFSLATEWLEKHATKSDVVVLFPCGSSRAELLRRLLVNTQYFSKAYVYKGFKEKLEYPGQEVEEYESIDELADKLKNKAEKPLAVVPESSFDALLLKDRLKQVSPNIRVKLLYLPALYSRATKELNWPSKDVEKLARVELTWLEKAYKLRPSDKGYSSTLLRDWKKEELEELKKAKEAILALSLGKLGLKDYLPEIAGEMIPDFLPAPLGTLVALAMDQLLGLLVNLNLREVAQKLNEKVGEVPPEDAEEFALRLLEGWTRPKARNIVAMGLAKLVITARKATSYLHREELETVVDQVALEWGMDDTTFKVFVKNLAKLASGEVVTREELRKELKKLGSKEFEELLKQLIEKRLSEIEKELNGLRGKVEALKIGVKLFYAHELEAGLLYPNFKVERGRPVVVSQEEMGRVEAELVTAGSFEKLAGEVVRRLEGGFVVLEGPKGIGKSTLATYTAWLALLRGHADAILYVYKLDVGEALRLENLMKNTGKRFLVLYDPSPLHAYYKPGAFAGETRETTNTESIKNTLQELLELARSETRVPVLAVLSSDLYNQLYEELSPQLRESLKTHTLHIDLRDHSFLEEIIKAYSGCHRDFKELAKTIARFEGGYTLIAKYAGLTLRNKGCRIGEVWKLVEEAKGKPKLFLAYYLWSILLKGNENLARRVAVPLLLHAAFGPIPEGITYLTAASRERPWRFLEPSEIEEKRFTLQDLRDEELEPVAKWLSVKHEDLMEEMLSELCGFEGREARILYAQHLPKLAGYQQVLGNEKGVLEWALNKVIDEKREAGTIKLDEALLHFTGERLATALKSYTASCWHRLALIAGFALAVHLSVPRTPSVRTKVLPIEAFEPCEADSYLLVGGEIPPLVVRVVLQRPSVLAHPLAHWHGEAAKELEKLWEAWRSRGKAYIYELLYGLGLALAVAGAADIGKKVETWEAEIALHTAVTDVQRVFDVECTKAILDFFRRLEELAPHCYVHLVSATSELLELEKETAHKIAESLEEAVEREELKVRGWPLVEAVRAYSNLLTKHREHFLGEEERLQEMMCKLLEWLEGQLRDIAEVYALRPVLMEGLKPCGGADPAGRAEELLKRLEEIEKEKPNGQVAEWATIRVFKLDEFNLLVKRHIGLLTFTLAWYKLKNDDLEVARKFFRRSAEIERELERRGYCVASCSLSSRSLVARCYILSARNLEELRKRARAFKELWKEAKNNERPEMAYLVKESATLAWYLVSLALEKRVSESSELLEREGWLLQFHPYFGVAVKLFLELLGVEVGKLEAREIVTALSNDINGELRQRFFEALSGAIHGDKEDTFLQGFREWLGKEVDKQSLSNDSEGRETVKRFYRELLDFVNRRGANAVVQLLAPLTPRASFTLMLWSLVNGDEELARAYAKLTWILNESKLLRRLLREAAEARSEEELKLALMKLFYLHF